MTLYAVGISCSAFKKPLYTTRSAPKGKQSQLATMDEHFKQNAVWKSDCILQITCPPLLVNAACDMLVVLGYAVDTCMPHNQKCFPINLRPHPRCRPPPVHRNTHSYTAEPTLVSPSFCLIHFNFPPPPAIFFSFSFICLPLSLSLLSTEEEGEARKCEAGREDQIVPVLLSLNCCNLMEARRNCA